VIWHVAKQLILTIIHAALKSAWVMVTFHILLFAQGSVGSHRVRQFKLSSASSIQYHGIYLHRHWMKLILTREIQSELALNAATPCYCREFHQP
jgi:hypothetical protein